MARLAQETAMRTGLKVIVFLLLATRPLNAQLTETKLAPSDGAAEDHFGISVAVSEGFVIVGSPEDDDNGMNSGSAYLFRWDGTDWSKDAKLSATGSSPQDFFGSAVDISGDRAIVGAYGDGPDRGAAYIYRLDGSTWTEETQLIPSDGAGGDFFGASVAIDGTFALVGAYAHASGSGAGYVFRRVDTVWSEVAKLTASDAGPSDYFGSAVSLSGNLALVGALWEDANGLNSGSAYVFRGNGSVWTEEAKLTAGDGASDDYFGVSVSVSPDYALIGAYGADEGGSGSGAAYMFRRNGMDWVEQGKLRASDAASNDFFGYSVAIAGDSALIGSAWDDDRGGSSGSAYLFHLDGTEWRQERKFIASDGAESDHFGRAVAISQDFAVAGAHDDDIAGSSSGSVYIYHGGATSVGTDPDPFPAEFELLQNYPNPFNPETEIGFRVPALNASEGQAGGPETGHVSLRIYDLLGREITTLVDGRMDPGFHSFSWDAKDAPSGVYVYQLRAGGLVQARRMILQR